MKTKDSEKKSKKERSVEVLTRFKRSELETMKAETGAKADATAVACFARKNLPRKD